MRCCFLNLFLIISGIAQGQLAYFPDINFHKADSVADFYHREDLRDLPSLTYKLTNSLFTEVEQFRAIYTWVCKNIENDYRYSLQIRGKREFMYYDSLKFNEWNGSFRKKVLKRLLNEQKTICTGYAYLLKELAALADIDCRIVDGYARTASSNVHELGIPNHSWNAVQLNGQWYLCDPTWSSGHIYGFGDVTKFVHDYNEGYFLTRPDFFFKNHYPLDTNWTLLGNTSEPDNFLNGPIVYDHTFRYGLNPVEPESMHIQVVKHDSILFSFETAGKVDPDKIYIELNSGSHTRTVEPEIISDKDGILVLRHTFNKTGYYDLRIKIRDNVLVSYTAAVKRRRRR